MIRAPALPLLKTLLLCAVVLAVAACTDPPDLDASVDPALEQADYPQLVPVAQILGPDTPDPEADLQRTERLEARAAGLQARAAGLQRTSGIDEETRRRLNSDIQTD
ncbi:hypothetical protein [Aestuariivita boseongensis]|uniref:hypothetical protein n=1 Tax=Aestuariivita boseongensis TaxID=1470562 RepID=UPI00067F9434|nr:hypothetical protein [Aestuariivita boseongensis]